MLMQAIDDSTLVVLRNKHSDDFEMWRIGLRADSARLVPIPLPEWLYRMMADETRILEGELAAEFLQRGDFMIPFKGLHRDSDGRLWLIPSPSHRVLALGLPVPGGMTIDVVVPSEREEHRGLLDVVVLGDRLYGLAETEIRVYGLEIDPHATLESVGIR